MVEKHNEQLKTEDIDSQEMDASTEDTKVKIERDDAEETAENLEQPQAGSESDTTSEKEILRARIAELEDKLLRTAAEFENRKKRLERQADDAIRTANDRLVGQLLDVVDNFERALHHGDENKESFKQGIELIFSQLNDLLNRYDVRPIDSVGQPFDPSVHEAIMQVDSHEYDEGIVALEISKGYRAGDRVLRYAKVGVSKGKSADNDSKNND
jgi:molecular chaperone GrpE